MHIVGDTAEDSSGSARKKGSQRKMGHRQPYTKVQIEAVNAKAPRATKAKAETEAAAE